MKIAVVAFSKMSNKKITMWYNVGMNEREKEYLKQWYITIFKCRITHKSVPWNCTCYIFANYEDMQKYCEKNRIKFNEYSHKDYFLLNEKNIGCIVGQRFNKVVLVSSNVPNLVKELCEKAIQDGYDIMYDNTMAIESE